MDKRSSISDQSDASDVGEQTWRAVSATNDRALIEEFIQRFPNHPRVLLAKAALKSAPNTDKAAASARAEGFSPVGDATDEGEVLWEQIGTSTRSDALHVFLARFPDHPRALAVRLRIDELKGTATPTWSEAPSATAHSAVTVYPSVTNATNARQERGGGSALLIGLVLLVGVGIGVWQFAEYQQRMAQEAELQRAETRRAEEVRIARERMERERADRDAQERQRAEQQAARERAERAAEIDRIVSSIRATQYKQRESLQRFSNHSDTTVRRVAAERLEELTPRCGKMVWDQDSGAWQVAYMVYAGSPPPSPPPQPGYYWDQQVQRWYHKDCRGS